MMTSGAQERQKQSANWITCLARTELASVCAASVDAAAGTEYVLAAKACGVLRQFY